MTVTRVSQSPCVPQHIVFEQNEEKKNLFGRTPSWERRVFGEDNLFTATSGFKGRAGLVSSPKNVRAVL